jgi:hypothetical protein
MSENPFAAPPNENNPNGPQAPRAVNPYEAGPNVDRFQGRSDEDIRREHIGHEASVKSIGTLYYMGAFFGVLVGGVYLVMAFAGLPDAPNQNIDMTSARIFLGFLGAFMGGLGFFQGVVAHAIRGLRPWSRIAAGVYAAIGLLGFPLGTLISAYFLWLLFSRKGEMVFSEEYKRVIAATPHVKYRTSLILWIILGVFVAAIVVAFIAVLAR